MFFGVVFLGTLERNSMIWPWLIDLYSILYKRKIDASQIPSLAALESEMGVSAIERMSKTIRPAEGINNNDWGERESEKNESFVAKFMLCIPLFYGNFPILHVDLSLLQ